MDELKEKIARAIATEDMPEMRWVELLHKPYLKLAQAALTAIEEAGFVLTRKQQAEGATHGCELMSPAEAAALYGRWPIRAECNARPPYATLADSPTSFDPEKQFEKDSDVSQKWGFRCDALPDGRCEDQMCLRHDCKLEKDNGL